MLFDRTQFHTTHIKKFIFNTMLCAFLAILQVINCFLLRLPSRDLYISDTTPEKPDASKLPGATQLAFNDIGTSTIDISIVAVKKNSAIHINTKTLVAEFTPVDPNSWSNSEKFQIVMDGRSGLKRVMNRARCLEYMPAENMFKMRHCIHEDNQLFEVVDVGA